MYITVIWTSAENISVRTFSRQRFLINGANEVSCYCGGLNSLELMLLSLGSCSTVSILHFLRKPKQNVTEFRTQVTSDITDSEPPDLQSAHIHFDIYGDELSESAIDRAIKLSLEKHCTVSKILRRAGIEISHSFDIHPTRSESPREDIEEPSLTTQGLHHVALTSSNYEASRKFYTDVMNMQVEWEPDSDNVYLTNGNDNLAIHRGKPEDSRLDHIGFILESEAKVDQWYEHLQNHNIPVEKAPKTHRDGARSFYVTDPDGVLVQLIYHPPLSDKKPNP